MRHKYLLIGFLTLTLGGQTILRGQNIDSAEVRYIVDINPRFNDSDNPDEFLRWFCSELQFPSEAIRDSFEGRVTAHYVVDSTGFVTAPFFLDSVPYYIKAEIERVLLSSPKWTPGIHEGKPVRTILAIPVNFTMDGIDKEEEPITQPSKKKKRKRRSKTTANNM